MFVKQINGVELKDYFNNLFIGKERAALLKKNEDTLYSLQLKNILQTGCRATGNMMN